MDGTVRGKAKVVIGGASMAFATQGTAVALQTAAPDAASTNAVLAANSNITAGFGPSPVFFAVDELGGAYSTGGTTLQTTTETVGLTVDLTKLASPEDLVAGLFNATVVGTGFTSLTFTVTGDGVSLYSATFTDVGDAETFFTNHVLDLGSLTSLPLSGNTLNLQVSFSVTTSGPGSGFYADVILGDPPPTAPHASRFAQAMAGMK